jgi:hypothetical protein
MKTCEQCGEQYGPRPREGRFLFNRRRFCSKRCTGLALNPRTANSEFKARYRQITTPDGRKRLEHRYVMEQELGRPLKRSEQVHHKNHDRLDNRPENLEVVTSAEHGLRHTVHPITKSCVICHQEFTPHKTKRVRAQTCSPVCKSALLSLRNAERKAS